MMFSARTLELAIVVGGAVLALWVVVRFPQSGPATPSGALLQIVAAYLTMWALLQALPLTAAVVPRPALSTAVVFVTLPPLVYLFTTIAWFVRNVQRIINR